MTPQQQPSSEPPLVFLFVGDPDSDVRHRLETIGRVAVVRDGDGAKRWLEVAHADAVVSDTCAHCLATPKDSLADVPLFVHVLDTKCDLIAHDGPCIALIKTTSFPKDLADLLGVAPRTTQPRSGFARKRSD